MRFEVKAGGLFVIVAGLTLLSGAVFILGVLAGYDVGRETLNDTQKVAASYPIEPPPAPANGVLTPEVSPATPAAAPSLRTAPPESIASGRQNAPAAQSPKPVVKTPRSIADEDESAAPEAASPPAAVPSASSRVASVDTPPPVPDTRRKPFNIEIEAAMDEASAAQMARRLQALGYQPHAVPTLINGSRWYRVEVGPYATQQEAAAAENELRRRYNTVYGRGGEPAQPSNSDEQGAEE
jgi:septal ring-binding cell division protein DamX